MSTHFIETNKKKFIATTIRTEKRNKRTGINYNFRRKKGKPAICVKYDPRYDPNAWYIKPSPDKYKPAWTFPVNRPLITYSSTITVMKFFDINKLKSDIAQFTPGRSYIRQGVCVYIYISE